MPDSDDYDNSIKVILLGDSYVGKSSLLNRLINNEFSEQQATIAIESRTYTISLNEYSIRMQIWDTAGQEKFNSIISNYYKGTDVGIFIYSITLFLDFIKSFLSGSNVIINSFYHIISSFSLKLLFIFL